jgi:hypothetical protein
MRYSLLLVILAIGVSFSDAQTTLNRLWTKRYANTPGYQPHEIPSGLGVDNNGNVYVTMSEAVVEWRRWITISYQSDGTLRWDKKVSSENGLCEPAGLAVEENGSKVYVTGYYRYDDDAKDNFYTVWYDGSSGETLWSKNYGLEDHDRAKAITMDDDYVYVTGYVDMATSGPTREDRAFCTIKYNKVDGDTDWVRIYNPDTTNNDEACALAVGNGNVFVTGMCWDHRSGESRWDILTISYDANGNVRNGWPQYYDAAYEDDVPKAIAVDDNENVYITGYSELSSINSDFYTISYTSSGGFRWGQRYNGTDNREDSANAIALDKAGHVYVTGSCQGKDSLDNFLTIRYDTDGGNPIIRTYDHDSLRDEAIALAVEENGKYVYVTGEVKEDDNDGAYYTIVYDAALNIVAYGQYDSTGNPTSNEDYANKIAIDDDYIYVTGASMGANFNNDNFDCVTIKYGKPYNVGCETIIAPTGTIDSGTVVTPACSVYNYGTVTSSYRVRMKIGSPGNWFYNETAYVSTHLPCSLKYVTFRSDTNWPRGTWAVKCSTELATDMNEANDKKTTSVTIIVKDVGCTKIIAPSGTIDSGTVVTPACSVYNYGTTTESYNVRMKIGGFYNETTYVLNHSPGSRSYVTFPNWTALQRGTHTVKCSTELATDMNKANDKKTDSVFVRVHDIGCTKIIAPTGTIDSGTVVTPACSVYNYGNVVYNQYVVPAYSVRMKIGRFYDQTVNVYQIHYPGTAKYITFLPWFASQIGTHTVTCSTQLSFDMNKINDKKTGSVTVQRGKGGGENNELTAIKNDSGGVEVQNPNDVNSKKIEQTTESNDSGAITPIYQTCNQGNMGSTIQIKTGINGVAILRIYNVLGKLLHSEKIQNGQFTMDGLPTGIYILRLQTKDRTEIRKLLIVK